MCRKLSILISLILVLSLFLTSTAKANLIGWYRLDDGSGTTAEDSSGKENHGTVEGSPKWVPGKMAGALQLGGSDYVVIDAVADDVTDNDITLCLWLKTSSNDAEVIAINSASRGNVMRLAIDSSSLVIDVSDPQGHSTTRIDDNEWHFATYVRSGATGYIYVDGVQENSSPASFNFSATDLWSIGQEWDSGGPSGFLNGIVDDVRIYDRALLDEEIQAAMQGEGWAYALGPDPTDGSYLEDTWASLSWKAGDFAASHDVYFGESFDEVDNGTGDTFRGNQTSTFYIVGFPGFPYPDGLVPGTTYYWRIDEVNEAEPNSPWKGDVWSFSVPPRTAYNPNPADGSQVADTAAQLKWTKGFGAKLHTVYFGSDYDTVSNAAGGLPQGTTTYNPGTLEEEKVYYWRVDEFDAPTTHKGDVWGFSSPGAVGNPQPANGATDAQMTGKLSWTAATTAVSHDVYFGTDKDAVRNATKASPEFKGNKTLGSESLDPGKLAWQSDYYWRVDAVYNAGPVKGLVWGFTTADFIAVDNFESYNDIDPPDTASNRIFDKWIDGFGTTDNGALVGNEMPPYAEQTVIHGGTQSMPYSYDNNLKTSEATLTLVYPRDWTEEGVTKLSLWFRGGSANSAERMFFALNGTAVVYNDNPAATQTPGWTRWVIDLQAFADQGVALTNVNTITIGLGTKNSPAAGGSGQMYFDDIRLRR